MIVDVRTYTMHPGQLPAMLSSYGKNGYPVQKKHLGACLGWFIAEVGVLNRVVHIWQYEDIADREKRRGAMAADPAWSAFLAEGRGRAQTQDNKIMKPGPFYPMRNGNPGPIGIVDVRTYTLKHGATPDFLNAYQEHGMPVQLQHLGHNLGFFTSDIGPLNQVLHIWAYPSVEERARRRKAMNEDPRWPIYLERSAALLQSMENSLMVPAPFWQSGS